MFFKGVSRTIDDLGRIVVPVEIRRILKWENRELLDITIFGDYVLLCAHDNSRESTTMKVINENPICQDIISCLNTLCAEDIICVQQLVKRFGQSVNPYSGADE